MQKMLLYINIKYTLGGTQFLIFSNIAHTAVEEYRLMSSLSNADNITLVCTCKEYPFKSFSAKECKCYQFATVICQGYCIFYLLFNAAFFFPTETVNIDFEKFTKMGFYHYTVIMH